jgi:hypothetical protein
MSKSPNLLKGSGLGKQLTAKYAPRVVPGVPVKKVHKGGGWERSKKLVKLLVVGFILEFLSHFENGVSIDKTLVVTEDNFALASSIHSALPTVLP